MRASCAIAGGSSGLGGAAGTLLGAAVTLGYATTIAYRLVGDVNLASGFLRRIPFDERGSVKLK